MCLFLQDQKQVEPSIATSSIKVYKVLEKNWNGRFFSPFRGKHYRFNELYRNKIGAVHKREKVWFFEPKRNKIESGLHSCIDPISASFIGAGNNISKIFIAKIPRGSEYFLGENGDIVSNQLIISDREYKPHGNIFQRIREWWVFKNL